MSPQPEQLICTGARVDGGKGRRTSTCVRGKVRTNSVGYVRYACISSKYREFFILEMIRCVCAVKCTNVPFSNVTSARNSADVFLRSEERRVGKEGRVRWTPCQQVAGARGARGGEA